MATIVTSSIGSAGGRDYSTLQAWEDACPANLVTADQVWKGEAYNDSEFLATGVSSVLCTIAGHTTDPTRYVWLTVASGQSFQDNAGVRTNALRYNQTNGVGFRNSGQYGQVLLISDTDTHLDRFQVSCSHAQAVVAVQINAGRGRGNNLLLQQHSTFSNTPPLVSTSQEIWTNVLAIKFGTAGGGFLNTASSGTSCQYIGCAAVRPSDLTAGGTGFASPYADGTVVVSCAVFGFTTAVTNGTATSKNNATDLASGLPGSNNQHSVTYSQTTPFTDADKDSLDLRAIAATSLAANGFLDATNAPNDISNTVRANPPTIGAWELVAAVGGAIARGLVNAGLINRGLINGGGRVN